MVNRTFTLATYLVIALATASIVAGLVGVAILLLQELP